MNFKDHKLSRKFDMLKVKMPDRLSFHGPVLVNTVGHCAGAIIFGILLYLFVMSWKRAHGGRSSLPAIAAVLGMLWNVGSLIALASDGYEGSVFPIIGAASFSVLSILPAVLLHISLGPDHRRTWVTGYCLSLVAVLLHAFDLVTGSERLHYMALLLVTFGFGGLTVASVYMEVRSQNRGAGSRLAGAMALFLFAISFVHFGSAPSGQMWEGEFALHHAGLPLALLVLLQDYRFLLLDAFLRFILNASLGAAAVLVCVRVLQSSALKAHLLHPFDAGILFVVACLLLAGFVYLRNQLQRILTRVLFLRRNTEVAIRELCDLDHAASDESAYVERASAVIAVFISTDQFELRVGLPTDPIVPSAVFEKSDFLFPAWAQAAIPFRFSRGETRLLVLGSRKGGRRYLSEDLAALGRLAVTVSDQVDRRHHSQMQQLVSQAELKALQAQINPHFLFNSLNTLYGTISRENAEARKLVLNLAEIFRYFLQAGRSYIQIADEMKIIRAYLDIEQLRLGAKLRADIAIDDAVLEEEIPILSIQPLVENAVKHGVAANKGHGYVSLCIDRKDHHVAVSVTNSGAWKRKSGAAAGVGLTNVRRRLKLCYGEAVDIGVTSEGSRTTVGFVIPVRQTPELSLADDPTGHSRPNLAR
jgi:hypothetical protein